MKTEEENVILKALKFEKQGSTGKGRKTQVEDKMKKNGLLKENACGRRKWRGVVKTTIIRNLAITVDGGKMDEK